MKALDEGIRLAKDQQAELQAVYVVEYPGIYVADVGYDPVSVVEPLVNEGKRVLEKVECLLKASHLAPKSRLVDGGHALDSIAEQLQGNGPVCTVLS